MSGILAGMKAFGMSMVMTSLPLCASIVSVSKTLSNAAVGLFANTINNQAAAAKKTLQTLTYKGETRRWNFESYVTAHKQQHQILEELV